MDELIQPIQPHQTAEAKRVILSVARNIFGWPAPLEEILQDFDARGELGDVDDPQTYYVERRGQFLVALHHGRVIGTGAIREFTGDTAELKRLWLLEKYHGQGIGYRLYQALVHFARGAGYTRIHLQTDRKQTRAQRFYLRLGFEVLPCASDDPDDVCMEKDV
jgi:GNAT superfamily N-acetyltransferase